MTDQLTNFAKLFLQLPFNLQDQFSNYIKEFPAINLILGRSMIDLSDINLLKARLAYDLINNNISLDLHNLLHHYHSLLTKLKHIPKKTIVHRHQ